MTNLFMNASKGATVLRTSMMRILSLILSFVCMSGIAHSKSEMTPSGFYGGLNSGVLFSDANLSSNNLGFTRVDGTCNTRSDFSSFFSGVQLGYAYQSHNKILWGIEADYNYNVQREGHAACTCDVNPGVSDQFSIHNQQQGSLRGRLGYRLTNQLLPFIVVGESVADLGMNYRNEAGDYYSKNTSNFGVLVGAGLEWQVTPTWSVRAEYGYTDYHRALNMKIPVTYELYDPNGGAHIDLQTHSLGLALNYWF